MAPNPVTKNWWNNDYQVAVKSRYDAFKNCNSEKIKNTHNPYLTIRRKHLN